MSDKNFKVKNGIDANGTISISSTSDSSSNLVLTEKVSTRTNLVLNPAFVASDTTGWGSYFASTNTIQTDNTAPYSTKVLQVQIPKTGNPNGVIWQTTDVLSANTPYSVSLYIKGPSGVQVASFSARPSNTDGSYLFEGGSNAPFTFDGTWQKIYLTSTPAVNYRPGFQIYIEDAQHAGVLNFYIHGVVVESGSTTNLPYFDGSQNAYASKYRATTTWAGTANASKSTVTYISQTSNAFEVNGNSSTIAKIDSYGNLTANGINANGASTISSSSLSDTTFSVSNISGQYGLIQAWNVAGSTVVQVDGNGHFYTINGRGVFVNSGWIGSTRFAVTPWQASAVGMIVRGQPSQTGDLVQFQDSNGNTYAKIGPYGQLAIGDTNPSIYSNARISLNTVSSSAVGLVVRAVSSQTSNITEWQDSSGNIAAKIGSDFSISSISGGFFGTMTGYPGNGTYLGVRPWGYDHVPFVVKGYTAQTGDLSRWTNDANTILAKIDSSGNATFNTVYVGLGGGSQATNIALGGSALLSNTTGFGNSAIGIGALQSNTTGWGNTAIGTYALQNYSGNVNTAIGYLALRNATTEGLVAIGYGALANNGAAYYNTAVGYGALTTTVTGGGNVAFGTQTLANATGSNNTGLGTFAGRYLTTGTDNVFIGQIAAQGFTTGSSNVVIGSYAAWYGTSTGSNNVFIGKDAGGSDITGNNNIVIGQLAQVSSSSISNEVTIGNSSITKFRIPGTGFVSDTSKTYSSKELDLRDVSTQFTNTSTGSIGQKINLWGGTYGIGIEAGRLVNYIPSTSYFVVKSSYGGSDLFTVSGSGATTFSSDVTVSGNLTVNGTTTNLNSTNLVIEDKNIILADVATPTDTTADGAGITIKGATDKTFNWVQSSGRFVASEPVQSSAFIGTSNVYTPQLGSTVIGSATLNTNADTGGILINTAGASNKGLIIKAAASQTGSLQEWQDSNGNITAQIKSYNPGSDYVFSFLSAGSGVGSYSSIIIGSAWLRHERRSSITRFGGSDEFHIGLNPDISAIAITQNQVGVFANSTTLPTFTVKGVASQTANLQEWKDSSNNILSSFTPAGQLLVNTSTPNWGYGSSPVRVAIASSSTNETQLVLVSSQVNSQSYSFLDIKGSTGNYIASISGAGHLYFPGMFGNFVGASVDAYNKSMLLTDYDTKGIVILTNGAANKGLIVRATASHTANLQEWQDSSGTVLSKIDSSGNIIAGYAVASLIGGGGRAVIDPYGAIYTADTLTIGSTNGAFRFAAGGITLLHRGTTTDITLGIKGGVSQTGDLIQVRNSSDAVLAKLSSGGMLVVGNTTGTVQIKSSGTSGSYPSTGAGIELVAGFDSGRDGIQAYNRDTNAWRYLSILSAGTLFKSTFASSVPVTIQGTTSQTGDLTQWQNSSGSALTTIDSGGGIYTSAGMWSTGSVGVVLVKYTDSAALAVGTGADSNKGIIVRGWSASQTASLQEWQSSSGTVLARVNAYGDFFITGGRIMRGPNDYGANLNINNESNIVGIITRANASQTADLQQWQNSAGTVLTSVDKDGYLQTPRLVITNGGNITDSAGTTPYFGFGSNQIAIYTRNAAYKGLVIQGSASQTANLQEWQDSAGTVMGRVDGQYGTIRSISGLDLTNTYTGAPTITARVNYPNTTPIIIVGAASQTANLQQWQNSAGTVLAKVAADGQLSIGNGTSNYLSTYDAYGNITSRTAGTNYSANISVLTGATNYIGMVIRGLASQTADLQQWQNSSGTVLARIASNGVMKANVGLVVENSTLANYTALQVSSTITNGNGIIVTGASGQTADLQQWVNSAGTVLAKVDANGNFSAISKSFDITHPTKENMRLRYASLEGPENGIYIRGTAESNIIELPEYWTELVHEDSITVSLTAFGSAQNIYVEKIENNKVYIGGELTKAFFTIYGERKDIDKLTVEY